MMKFRLALAVMLLTGVTAASAAPAAPPRALTDTCRVLAAELTSAGADTIAVDSLARTCTARSEGSYRAVDGRILDAIVCPILRAFSGIYLGGFVIIFDDGDVWVYGIGFIWDCPPYAA
jgi:hypothetical protein